MEVIYWVLLATLLDGLVAFAGAFGLALKPKTLKKLLMFLVAFSAGALIGGAFFHLIAESLEGLPVDFAFLLVIAGFCLFFIMERFLYWHHCHEGKCKVHPFTYLILVGDGVHNFIDGLVIAASFLVSIPFGIVTTFLIIAHEIPQELGDFGILVYGGMEKKKALLYNFVSQLTCVVGGLAGVFLAMSFDPMPLLPFAAGGFIYIAMSDLVPELHKEKDNQKAVKHFALFLVGLAFMLAIKWVAGA
ncbi:MAG: ZIP family metal transporter [Candidatus Diapherotrites archaeon]|nr:ZIP family metal transporter [Candidatus Diapherotrites archaeon]